MKTEQCTACGHKFDLTRNVRSREGIFFTFFPRSGLFSWIEEYFVVICPKCNNRQVSDNIKMFGFISRKYAAVSLILFLFAWVIVFGIFDRFDILKS